MIGLAGCERTVMQSSFSSTFLITLMFSLKFSITLGVSLRTLIPSDAATASIGGIAAEKTNEVPLMRWCSVMTRGPAQKPPLAQRVLAAEPMIMSTEEAGTM